ncbi:MAG: alpha/beta hydrolase [Desulfuromonadales bacterium]|nr:alpha/beta hydrolase [Desulfuromonadales bacterium]
MEAHIDNVQINYDDTGSGPAVILLHEFPLNRNMWRPQTQELVNNGFRVIAPDLRGFGRTPSHGKPFSIATHSQDVITLMNYLGIGRAVVVAAATAGRILIDLNRRFAHRLSASCFIGQAFNVDDSVHTAVKATLESGKYDLAMEMLGDQFLPEHRCLHTQQRAHDVNKWIKSAEHDALLGWLRSTEEAQLEINPDIKLRHALLLTGDAPSQQSALHISTNIATEVVAGAGRLLNLDKSGVVNQSLLDFLGWLNATRVKQPDRAVAA